MTYLFQGKERLSKVYSVMSVIDRVAIFFIYLEVASSSLPNIIWNFRS